MEDENPKLFDLKMEEPQRHALKRDWLSFKNYFQQKPTDLIEPFNLAGNTAIHIAARSDNLDLLRDLLDMLKKATGDDYLREALRKGNAHENTLLHQVVLCGNVKMVDAVINYEATKELRQPGDESLLELRNDLGETPVYRAAKYGRFKMLKRMARYVHDMEPHLFRKDFTSILHIAVIGQHFDVALWLTRKKGIDWGKVASAYEKGIIINSGSNSNNNNEQKQEAGKVASAYEKEGVIINSGSNSNNNNEQKQEAGKVASAYEKEGIIINSNSNSNNNNEQKQEAGKVASAYEKEGIIINSGSNSNNNNEQKQEAGNESDVRGGNKKKDEDDDADGLSCLQLLSRMPSVFGSYNSQAGFFHNLIYLCLPNRGYNDDDDEDENNKDGYRFIERKEDLETATNKVTKKYTSPCAVSSKIYCAMWKLVAKEWDSVKEIWRRKMQNKQAKQVAKFLVRIDNNNSWRDTKHGVPRTEVVVPVIQPSNAYVAATNKPLFEKTTSFQKPIPCKKYTPLLLAASTGIIEIVEEIIEAHPDAVSHISLHDEQNVLHVAVKHRQKRIYKHLKKYKALRGLASHIDGNNRTLLHQVARMDYYDGGNQPGVVFQLQEEIHWFERVKKRVPRPYQLFCNKDNLTARELFDSEHSEMLKEAQEWIKGTAQSCSAVSVLVATVVFAAAYTVPGGTDEHGVPNFLNAPLFLFFTIMDVVGLASSLISVMMFLSILTSPFQMKEFRKSLPRKLTMGFTLLFISLTSTMLAFGSTILLTIRMESKKWSSSLIYSITFFPVTLFGLTQFPIVMAVKYRLKRLWKIVKKIIPNDIITLSTTKPTCKKDYSKYL